MGQAAWGACVVMIASYSRGQSAEGGLAASPVVGPFDPGDDGDAELIAVVQRRLSSTLRCRSAKNDSMAALSPAEPTWPMEPTIR